MLDGTDTVTPPRTDGGDDAAYYCDVCETGFEKQQQYASHFNSPEHKRRASESTQRPPRRLALRRAYGLISDGEVGKLDLLSFAFGALAGIFLAHEPSILGNLAVTGGIAVTAYRVFLRVSNKEMGVRGIQYLDTFVAGAIFGFVGVQAAHQDMPLDVLAHGLGSHTH